MTTVPIVVPGTGRLYQGTWVFCGHCFDLFKEGKDFGCDVSFAEPKSRIFSVPVRHRDVCKLDVTVHDPSCVCGVQRVDNFRSQLQKRFDIKEAFPLIRCFSVCPSSNSMAMKCRPSLQSICRSCRCLDDSARRRQMLRAENVRALQDRAVCKSGNFSATWRRSLRSSAS